MVRTSPFTELQATLRLAVPIAIGQASQMLMGLLDSVMIGRVGTVPLAASAFAGNIFGVFFVLGIGLPYSVATLISQAHGAKRPDECALWLRHGVMLAVAYGIVESGIMWVIGLFLGRLGQPPEVVAQAGGFFRLIAISLIPAMAFQVLRQFAESLGRPWIPMTVMLGGVGLNAGLNWLLIYGHAGFPALGLLGAGWATLVARSAVLVTLFLVLRRDSRLAGAWPRRWRGNLDLSRIGAMLRLGLPASGQLLFESGAFAASAIMMGWLGAVSLAAHQVALSCAATTFMFLLGLAMAVNVRIAQASGASEGWRIRPIGFGALGLGVVVMGGFALVFLVAGPAIARGFVDDPNVSTLAAKLLFIAAIFQIFDGGQVVGSAILRGLTDVRVPTLITFVGYWLIALPLGYLLGFRAHWGAAGIWAGLAVGLAFAAIFFAVRFYRLTARVGASQVAG